MNLIILLAFLISQQADVDGNGAGDSTLNRNPFQPVFSQPQKQPSNATNNSTPSAAQIQSASLLQQYANQIEPPSSFLIYDLRSIAIRKGGPKFAMFGERFYTENDRIEGYTIQHIYLDKVVLQKNGQTIVRYLPDNTPAPANQPQNRRSNTTTNSLLDILSEMESGSPTPNPANGNPDMLDKLLRLIGK